MLLYTTLSVFLLWTMTFVVALPAATSEATGTSATASTPVSASPSDNADSTPDVTYISSTPDACPDCTVLASTDTLPWSFNGWKSGSLRGDSFVSMHRNGDVRLQYSFKNVASLTRIKYAIGCAIRDTVPGEPAHVFQLGHDGRMGAAAEPEHTARFDQTRNEPAVAQFWENILKGDMTMRCEVRAGYDVAGIIGHIIEVIKEYGPIVAQIAILF
ncbi:hypothetical protein LTR70_005104 [Exophiala xenobiotica]|uniref:Uncharacterized protein n=1 Tax=Lithohypha guttulata TaxID=1690604 RepID=A0ABR0KB08_9EURO|nr:hypothetical protein LTR24_004828 [Lithohypha guttulata]KAK5319203.1 hypothetical protein LTR70_005104 [Exophiala xenobiotica]